MSSPAGHPAVAVARPRIALVLFVCEAFRHATRLLVEIALLLGMMRSISIFAAAFLTGAPIELYQWTRLLFALISALFMLGAVLCAEQAVRQGMRRVPSYLAAVLLFASASGIFCGVILAVLDRFGVLGYDGFVWWRAMLFLSADALGRGGLAAFVYSNYRQMLDARRRLGAAQVERSALEQRLADERLHALRARVDPDRLFGTLASVEALYQSAPELGDRALDQLIKELRTATARVPI